jgi:predicted PurR-regulated permease PerM
MNKTYKIEISAKTIVFTVLFLVFINLLWLIRELIFSFFIAFIVMSALNPLITSLENKKIPRALTTILTFIIIFFGLGYLFVWLIPPVAREITLLSKNIPKILENIVPSYAQLYGDGDFFNKYLPNITNNAFKILKNVFSNIIFMISTIFFSFYFLVEEDALRNFIIRFFNKNQASKILTALNRTEKRLRNWFWGELVLMFIIGTLTYIGLTLLNIKFALALSLIAGLLEIVPILGPVLSAIPAIIVALSESMFSGLAVVALYFIIQQSENQIIVPLIMKKAVGLNPIITLAALIIGGRIGGILGILLAIPVTLFIESILLEYLRSE